MKINEKLKELRKSKNLTQEQISKMLCISKTGYASWEQSLSEPNIQYIIKICKIYDISADELLGIDETKEEFTEFEYKDENAKYTKRTKKHSKDQT